MKKKFKKSLSAIIAAVLLIGIVPTRYASAEEVTGEAIEEQIGEIIGSESEVVVESKDGELTVETDVYFDEEIFDLSEEDLRAIEEAAAYKGDSNADPITVADANVNLTFNYETNEVTLKSTETDQEGNKTVSEYIAAIDNATEEGIQAEFTDIATGESYEVNSDEIEASFFWFIAIPVGVVIGEALLAHLISIGLAMVLSGVTYLAISEFLKKQKNYNHYMAHIDDKGKFWVGNGLSKSAASTRLASSKNTWSTSSSNAAAVAKDASPISKALGPEIDGGNNSGKLYHYHPVIGYKFGRSLRLEGAHAFFGSPQ